MGRNKRSEGSQQFENCVSQDEIGYTAIINDPKILAENCYKGYFLLILLVCFRLMETLLHITLT